MLSGAPVDHCAIEALLAVLTRVKNNAGRVDGDDVWFDKKQISTVISENDRSPQERLRDLRQALQELEDYKSTLTIFRKSLEKRISSLGKTCNELALRCCGVIKLPNEILSQIFEFAHSGMGHHGYVVSTAVYRTCRLFRAVSLKTPRLWSVLKSHRPHHETRQFLSRSGAVPLQVYYDPTSSLEFSASEHGIKPIDGFFQIVVPYCSRWSSLHLTCDGTNFANVRRLFESHPGLQLPHLTNITFNFECPIPQAVDRVPYHLWVMPALSCFESANMLPGPAVIDTTVTNCQLQWKSTSTSRVNLDMSLVMQRLQDLPQLEHLSLDFGSVITPPQPLPPAADCISLERLTTLSVCFSERTHFTFVDQMFRNISLPNVTNFSITFDQASSHGWPLIFWRRGLRPIIYPNLQTFNFSAMEQVDDRFLTGVLGNCPSLLHLSINAPGFVTDVPAWSQSLALRTMRLENCDRLQPEQVEVLADKLRHAHPENWHHFEKLEIVSCRFLTEQFLLRFEDDMEGKLQWTL